MFRHVRRAAGVSVLVTAGALLCFGLPMPQTPPKADNTAVNKNGGPTADQQKENAADRTLSQQIRKAVLADKSLSTYAHNVKIISRNGTVTLRGPVRSETEKAAIEAKAKESAGVSAVDNELTIQPKKGK
jgi:hyperosmotically inducible periplasmic protein